jgi:hypothetical protein
MASLPPIDLFRGWPASELIPVDSLKDAAIKALSSKSISEAGFGYGPDEGYHPLRQNIAKWLTDYYGPQETITSDRVCITGGASQNLASILQVFTDPLQTEMIWLVEPTYHLIFRPFEDAGFYGRMRAIPEDESGMDVQALERALEELTHAGGDKNSHKSYVRYLTALLLGAVYLTYPRLANQLDLTGRSTNTSSTVYPLSLIHRERQWHVPDVRHWSAWLANMTLWSYVTMSTTSSLGLRDRNQSQ